MTFNLGRWTFELTRSHAYFKAMGYEGLLDFTGQVGNSFDKV